MYILLFAASDLLPEVVLVLFLFFVKDWLFIITVRQATETVRTEEMKMILGTRKE